MVLKARYVQATTDRGREKVMIELGRTLERAGVVEKDDRQRMMDLVSGRADPQALIDLGKKAKDRIGFWKWLAENKDSIGVTLNIATFLLTALELFLKATGRLP